MEIEIASAANVADMLMEFINDMSSQFGGEAPEVDIESADINLDFNGEGTLFWNLEGGHASQGLPGAHRGRRGVDQAGQAVEGAAAQKVRE